jgi:hypothetical protein
VGRVEFVNSRRWTVFGAAGNAEATSVTKGRELDKQHSYEIRVKGVLDDQWSDWFDGFEITSQANDETKLTGLVADQAALHGMLAKIRDLGLPLVLVKRTEE